VGSKWTPGDRLRVKVVVCTPLHDVSKNNVTLRFCTLDVNFTDDDDDDDEFTHIHY